MTETTTAPSCKRCGTPLQRMSRGPAPTYCSATCRARAKDDRAKLDGRYAQQLAGARVRTEQRQQANAKPCPYCSAPMTHPKRVQCGAPECKRRYNAERMRELQLKHKAKTGHWLTDKYGRKSERTCIHCDKSWESANAKAKYCSNACQAEHEHGPDRRRKLTPGERARLKRWRRRRLAEQRLAAARAGTRGRRVIIVGTCCKCGKNAAGYETTAAGLFYCSALCRRREQAALRRGGSRRIDRQAIYRRDKHRCQICHKAVAMTKTVPHPMAPVLDHIIPIAEGGTTEQANLRLAHFLCNSIRRDKGGNEQLMLIG